MASDTGLPTQSKSNTAVASSNDVQKEGTFTEYKKPGSYTEYKSDGKSTTTKEPPKVESYTPKPSEPLPKKSIGMRTQGFINRIAGGAETYINNKIDTVNKVKKTITVANGKRFVVTAAKETYNNVVPSRESITNKYKNASSNFNEDISYLGQQAVSSIRNVGLSEKQSAKKYGDVQYPTLFGGSGGYADIVTKDKATKRHIKQVSEFDQSKNNMMVKSNNVDIDLFKSDNKLGHNPMDIFAKTNKKPTTKEEKKIKDLETKLKNQNKKKGKVKKQSLNDLGSVGVISSPFGSEMNGPSGSSIRSNGIIGVDFSRMESKPKKISAKQTNRLLNDSNPYNDPFGSFKGTKQLGGSDAMSSIFGQSNKKPKGLKGQKFKMDSMNSIFNTSIFGKRKKGGLF